MRVAVRIEIGGRKKLNDIKGLQLLTVRYAFKLSLPFILLPVEGVY